MTYKAMKPKVIASIVLFNHSYDDIKDTLLSLCHKRALKKLSSLIMVVVSGLHH